MAESPYFPPTYFPAAYFSEVSLVPVVPSPSPTGLTPYDAPSYFPASYFYGAGGSTVVPTPTGLLPYNAPTYFAPAYFYGPSSSTPVVPIAVDPPGSARDPYRALISLIEATGLFEGVALGSATRRGQSGADTYPLAVLTPKRWEELDDVDPISLVRQATFAITIIVKMIDDLPRFDELDRLAAAIKAAFDGSDLFGQCLPALSRIRSATYEGSDHYPEQSIALEGEFAAIIDPLAYVPATS